MTQANKLAAIYAAKLDIREAIKAKGVAITNDEPFSGYAAKILLIEGSGHTEPQKTTEGLEICESVLEIIYIPAPVYTFYESLSLYGKPSEEISESMEISYPSTSKIELFDVAVMDSIPTFGLAETAELEFSLWAYAESFRHFSADKYSYDAVWVEFTDRGVYVRNKVFETVGEIDSVTENGVVFSVPLPHRQSYGGLKSLYAKLGGVSNGN